MTHTTIFNEQNKPDKKKKQEIVSFLHTHLEQYGDSPEDILRAVNYAVKDTESFGGFVVTLACENELLGAVVVNRTGMQGYIPENILVYIATHNKHRGEGIGKALMKKAVALAMGDIALLVESGNPARFLYKKFGFVRKYMEMRRVS